MKPRISLLPKIISLVSLLVMAGGGATAYLVYTNSTKALKNSISSNQLEITKQTMDKLDRFLYERQIDIETATSRQQIRDFLSGKTGSSASRFDVAQNLQSLKETTGAWDEIAVLDTSGKLIISSEQNETVDLPDPIQKELSRSINGQVAYSDVFISPDSHQPTMVFLAPVRSTSANQNIIGVIEGELAWPLVTEILQSLGNSDAQLVNIEGLSLGNSQAGSQSEVLKHSYLSSAAVSAAQKTAAGSSVLPGINASKNQYVTSYVSESGFLDYKGNGWRLILQTPEKVAFKPARDLARTLIIIFLVILVVSVLMFVIVLHRLVISPIFELKEIISRIAKGDFSLRASIASGDELGDLGYGLNDMADKMQFAYKSLRESTEEARSEKRILETILENLPVGVMVVKAPTGEPILMNRAGQEISGRQANTQSGAGQYTQVYDVIKEDGTPYPTDELPLTMTLKTGQTVMKDNMVLRRPDGSTVTVRAITTPIDQEKGIVKTAVSVFEDISKERELERSREEFFSIASHELRTPLTAIRGNASLIQQYYWNQLPDNDVKEMVSDIHESSIRLIDIVNDFLDTSRLEQKRMKFEIKIFDIVELSKSVIKEYQVTSSRQKIHLEVIDPEVHLAKVKADQNRVRQVLINLVGNALKFTENGSVTISFGLENNFVKVYVKDTGKGMTPDAQHLLFKKFEQTGSNVITRDSTRGTGLGLYISKLIMEQMGGAIRLESSALGAGTVFSFSVPIA